MESSSRGLGWIPQTPDPRDHRFAADPAVVTALPPAVDLRPQMPPVEDQGHLGSCTSFAIAGAVSFAMIKQGEPPLTPSHLFIYYNERDLEGTVPQDAGAMLRDGMKAINALGVCDETLWPYDITTYAVKPPEAAYRAATLHDALEYQAVTQDALQVKSCLAAGFPCVVGIQVFGGFMSPTVAQTGIVPLPAPGEQSVGGHAVLIAGYDDPSGVFIMRNSWGPSWGQQGYFSIPQSYILNPDLADDFWTIRKMA